jgi:hypothetical protein
MFVAIPVTDGACTTVLRAEAPTLRHLFPGMVHAHIDCRVEPDDPFWWLMRVRVLGEHRKVLRRIKLEGYTIRARRKHSLIFEDFSGYVRLSPRVVMVVKPEHWAIQTW